MVWLFKNWKLMISLVYVFLKKVVVDRYIYIYVIGLIFLVSI